MDRLGSTDKETIRHLDNLGLENHKDSGFNLHQSALVLNGTHGRTVHALRRLHASYKYIF